MVDLLESGRASDGQFVVAASDLSQMAVPVLVRLLSEHDIPWLLALARKRYAVEFDADSTTGWFRNICLKAPLLFHPVRTDNGFCITMLTVMPWLPTIWEAHVVLICVDHHAGWEALRLLHASVDWARRRKATVWRICSETDYDLAPFARRLGAEELSPRFTLRL